MITALLVLLAAPVFAQNGTAGPAPAGSVPVSTPVERADAALQIAHSHTTGATLTLSAGVAGGSTQSIYIVGIDISNCAGASAVTAANPTYITTTGLNGSPQYQLGSGVTAGLCQPAPTPVLTAPIKSQTPGTNVTIVLPAFATNQTVSVNVYYRLGF